MAPLWSCLFQLTAGLCDVYVYEDNKNMNAPPGHPSGWTPRYRYPTSFEVRYKAPRPPPRRQHQRGRPGGVTAPDPPKAAPKVSAPLEGACLRGNQLR